MCSVPLCGICFTNNLKLNVVKYRVDIWNRYLYHTDRFKMIEFVCFLYVINEECFVLKFEHTGISHQISNTSFCTNRCLRIIILLGHHVYVVHVTQKFESFFDLGTWQKCVNCSMCSFVQPFR